MEKRINLLTQENDILIQNMRLLKEKYNEAERILKNRNSTFDSTYNQMMADQQHLKELQKGNIELKRVNKILEDKYQEKENQANKLG